MSGPPWHNYKSTNECLVRGPIVSVRVGMRTISFRNYAAGGAAKPSGGRLNKKDGLTRYGDSHVKDKTS